MEPMNNQPFSVTEPPPAGYGPRVYYLLTGLIWTVLLGLIFWSAWLGRTTDREELPKLTGVKNVVLEFSLAYLWTEKFLHSDDSRGKDSACYHFDSASRLVDLLLGDGQDEAPVSHPGRRSQGIALRNRVQPFQQKMEARMRQGLKEGPDGPHSVQFDLEFRTILSEARSFEDAVVKAIAARRKTRDRHQQLILLGGLALALFTFWIIRRYDRGQRLHLRSLRASNQQLRAAEQQLRAGNQQLRATEQQLRAGNQQLRATEQQLRASNQQLHASEAAARSSAERAQMYLDIAGSCIVALDREGRVTLANRKAREVLCATEGEIIGKDWFDNCLPQRIRAEVRLVFSQLMDGTLENTEFFENPVLTRKGEERLIAWHNVLIRGEDGVIRGTLSSGDDITDARKRQEEMQKIQKLESLGVLAAGIAHDFNNLLGGLFGYVELAREQCPKGGKPRDYLDRSMAAFGKARALTQQLLTFAKGGLPQKGRLSIGTLVAESAGLAVSGSNVRVEIDLPPEIPCIEADEGQLSQVVNNIVLNARQAMPEGGTVRLSAREIPRPGPAGVPLPQGRYLEIRIADTGVGIPEKHLAKIFDPFFTTKQQGSGLGLSISHSIIRNHGGHIAVQSVQGEGATFAIYLPVSDDAAPDGWGCSPAVAQPAGSGRILVMDDEPVVLDMVVEMARDLGYQAQGARNGATAVESFVAARDRGAPFDLVILDLTVVNGMGGVKTLEALRQIDPGVRAVVSSGYSDDPVLADPAAHGFAGKAVKPYSRAELAAAIASALKKS